VTRAEPCNKADRLSAALILQTLSCWWSVKLTGCQQGPGREAEARAHHAKHVNVPLMCALSLQVRILLSFFPLASSPVQTLPSPRTQRPPRTLLVRYTVLTQTLGSDGSSSE